MPNPNPNPNPNLIIDSHHVNQTLPSSSPKPNAKILSIFLKFIIMSLTLSLFLLFLGLAAILLLHLLLAGSFFHRRRHLPRATASLSLHLPPFTYKARDQQSSSSLNNDCCSICLEYYNEGEICRVIPVCEHVFHARCVDTWLVKVPSCPVCRTRVRFGSHGSSSDLVVSDYDDENKFLWGIGVGR